MDATELARARAAAIADRPELVGTPLRIRDEHGRDHGWFVPLVDHQRILGFVDLDRDLVHRRTSWFASRPGSDTHPPPVGWWLDRDVVQQHARPALDDDERMGDPYLSFDTVPDRLAWAVPVSGPSGDRIVFVAGAAVWSASRGNRWG